MGVITTTALPVGRVYGPIPPHVTLTDPMVMIGHMTTDSRPDVHTVKVSPEAYSGGHGLAEWVPYVQAARDEREQNIEALLKDGQLYYRVVRPVGEGTELLVWYSADLAQIIGVPELRAAYIKDGGNFCCPYCRKWFRFPNCLRAHMRFKCESSRHIYSTSTTTTATTNLNLSVPAPLYSPQSLGSAVTSSLGSNFALTSNLASPMGSGSSSSPPYHPRASPPTRPTREDRLSEGGISPGSTSSGVSSSSLSPPNSAEKRKRDDDDDAILASKRFLGHSGSDLSPGSTKSPSPPGSIDDNGSAFHKVERGSKSGSPLQTSGSPPQPVFQHPNMAVNPYVMSVPGLMRPPMNYPIPPPTSQPSPFPPSSQYSKENIPVSLSDITRLANGLPVRARIPGMDAIAAGKMPFHPDWRFHFPYYKSQNPIVENILQSATSPHQNTASYTQPQSLALMQNWCAKCNATFRMTSDLVYHMRSHHKGEFAERKGADPVQQEGKLECSVCGERFRERHHLTRHMTSHQDSK